MANCEYAKSSALSSHYHYSLHAQTGTFCKQTASNSTVSDKRSGQWSLFCDLPLIEVLLRENLYRAELKWGRGVGAAGKLLSC